MQYVVTTGVLAGTRYDAARGAVRERLFCFGSVPQAGRYGSGAGRSSVEVFVPLLFDVTNEVGVQTAVSKSNPSSAIMD